MTPEPRWCQTTTAEKRMGRMNARGMLVAVNRTAGEWGGRMRRFSRGDRDPGSPIAPSPRRHDPRLVQALAEKKSPRRRPVGPHVLGANQI